MICHPLSLMEPSFRLPEPSLNRLLTCTLDAGGPDILGANLTLAKHENNVCIIIAHKVIASMKTVLYAATSAITATEFLAAECNCKAGCNNQRSSDLGQHTTICTHSITEPMQMNLLMFRGMAELVLAYFRRCMRRENANDLDEHCQKQIRDDILLLIKATGMRPPSLDANATVVDLVVNYAETTGRAKISPGEPNPRNLGLLRLRQSHLLSACSESWEDDPKQ
jgi:hypothetical protein